MKTVAFVILALIIIAALLFYRSPEVRELVAPRKQPRENPLEFLEKEPPPRRPAEQAPSETRPVPERTPGKQPSQQPAAPSEEVDQLSSDELSRVLLQILAARQLACGVSIMVDAETIEVNGEVDSEEKRRQILHILDSGRGTRTVAAEGLTVRE
jgi:hypothetical protein